MMVQKLVGWCNLGEYYEYPYCGPKHPCPANPECADGQNHYLVPRQAWVCEECGWAYLQVHAPEKCDHPLP